MNTRNRRKTTHHATDLLSFMALKEGSILKIDNFEGPRNHVQETKETERGHAKPWTKPNEVSQKRFTTFCAILKVKSQNRNRLIPQMKKSTKIQQFGSDKRHFLSYFHSKKMQIFE